jgi:ATP-dependent Clp protease protease subunit
MRRDGRRGDMDASWPPSGLIGQPGWPRAELFTRRVVFVTGLLDGPTAARTSAELMTLDATGTGPVDVYIDSPGGTLDAALILMDTLDLMRAETRTHALGEVGGAALGVLAVGSQRRSGPSARLRLVEPQASAEGTTERLLAQADQHRHLTERFHERLARATGRSESEIANDLKVGRYLDAREALDYGLIDDIAARGPRATESDHGEETS